MDFILGQVFSPAREDPRATVECTCMTIRLAREYGKLEKVPAIKILRPADSRSGFFERPDFEAVARALPVDLALVVRIGYVYGWRLRSEVLTLTKALDRPS
jgi:hypothetical protein